MTDPRDYTNSSDLEPSAKRRRSSYSLAATDAFRAVFATNAYPDKPHRQHLAHVTGESEIRVKSWFKYQRVQAAKRGEKVANPLNVPTATGVKRKPAALVNQAETTALDGGVASVTSPGTIADPGTTPWSSDSHTDHRSQTPSDVHTVPYVPAQYPGTFFPPYLQTSSHSNPFLASFENRSYQPYPQYPSTYPSLYQNQYMAPPGGYYNPWLPHALGTQRPWSQSVHPLPALPGYVSSFHSDANNNYMMPHSVSAPLDQQASDPLNLSFHDSNVDSPSASASSSGYGSAYAEHTSSSHSPSSAFSGASYTPSVLQRPTVSSATPAIAETQRDSRTALSHHGLLTSASASGTSRLARKDDRFPEDFSPIGSLENTCGRSPDQASPEITYKSHHAHDFVSTDSCHGFTPASSDHLW